MHSKYSTPVLSMFEITMERERERERERVGVKGGREINNSFPRYLLSDFLHCHVVLEARLDEGHCHQHRSSP